MLIREGHNLALTPDGRCLVHARSVVEEHALDEKASCVVRLLDAGTLVVHRTLELTNSWINSLACSGDGTLVALGCGWFFYHDSEMHPYWRDVDPAVRLLRLPGAVSAAPLDVHGIVHGVAFSPRHLAVLRRDRLGFRPQAALQKEYVAAQRAPELDVAYSPAGDFFVSCAAEQGLWRWTIGPDRVRRERRLVAVGGGPLAFSPNGRLLACRGAGGLCLYDTTSWQLVREIETLSRTITIAFDPGSGLLAQAGSRVKGQERRNDSGMPVSLWSAEHGRLIWSRPGHTGNVYHLAFSPDGKLLASASADGAVRLWDVEDGRPVAVCAHEGPVWGNVAFSPDGALLASAGAKSLRLWNRDGTLHEVCDGCTGQPWFLQDGTLLLTSNRSARALHPHLPAMATTCRLPLRRLELQGSAVAIDPQREMVATISSGDDPGPPGLHVYCLRDGSPLEVDAPPVRIPQAVCGHPCRDLFATGDADGFVRLLEASTGEVVTVFPAALGCLVSALQFDPAGQLLAVGLADGRVLFLNAGSGAFQQALPGAGRVESLSFDRDGRWLAVVGEGRIRLFSLPGSVLLAEFPGFAAAVGHDRCLFTAGQAGVQRHLF